MSAQSEFFLDFSLIAQSDLSSSQYFIVRTTGADTATLCTSATGGVSRPFGVLQNDPTSGQAAQVRNFGMTKLSAGGTITAGDLLTSTTGGQALSVTTTGQFVFGKANTASTAASQIIEAFVFPGYLFVGSTA